MGFFRSEIWISIGLILGLEFFLLIAVSLALTGISNDRTWDRLMEGELKFPVDSGFFVNKSMVLEEPEWSAEKELLTRPLALDTLFVVLCFLLKFAGAVHVILLYCIPGSLGGRRTRLTIVAIYLSAGCGILIGAVLAAVACSKVGDNCVQVMHLFYNRVQRDSNDHFIKKQDYSTIGMDSLDEALLLMDIIGICMAGSLHTSLNPEGSDKFPTPLLSEIRLLGDDNVYNVETLTRLHFCQLESHKVAGVIFGLLSSILCFGLAGLTGFWLWNSHRKKLLHGRKSGGLEKEESGTSSESTSTLIIGDVVPKKKKDKKLVQAVAALEDDEDGDEEDEEEEEESALSGMGIVVAGKNLKEGGQQGQHQMSQRPVGGVAAQFVAQHPVAAQFASSRQGQESGVGGQIGYIGGINSAANEGSLSVAVGSSGSGEFKLMACTSSASQIGGMAADNVRTKARKVKVKKVNLPKKTGSSSGLGSPGTGSQGQSQEKTGASPGWTVFP